MGSVGQQHTAVAHSSSTQQHSSSTQQQHTAAAQSSTQQHSSSTQQQHTATAHSRTHTVSRLTTMVTQCVYKNGANLQCPGLFDRRRHFRPLSFAVRLWLWLVITVQGQKLALLYGLQLPGQLLSLLPLQVIQIGVDLDPQNRRGRQQHPQHGSGVPTPLCLVESTIRLSFRKFCLFCRQIQRKSGPFLS